MRDDSEYHASHDESYINFAVLLDTGVSLFLSAVMRYEYRQKRRHGPLTYHPTISAHLHLDPLFCLLSDVSFGLLLSFVHTTVPVTVTKLIHPIQMKLSL